MHLERWRALTTAAAIVLAAAAPAAAGGRECAVDARLQWVDVTRLAPFAYRAMAAEARRVLAQNGICADLVRASVAAVRTKGEIGVILLRSMGGSGRGRRVMGATRSHDPGNSAVWIYFDEVVSALGLGDRSPDSWSGPERQQIGRALGRVAAHEIVHVLLPDRPHDPAGLMAPTFGRRELAADLGTDPLLAADVRRSDAER